MRSSFVVTMFESAWTTILVGGKALPSVELNADQELYRCRIRRRDGSSALETRATIRTSAPHNVLNSLSVLLVRCNACDEISSESSDADYEDAEGWVIHIR
jgi:hypothetical protein